jgi:3-dehydroquinate synthase
VPRRDPLETRDRPIQRRIRQSLSVRFEYDALFTECAFDADNDVLVSAFTRLESDRRHGVVAVLDAGMEAAWPEVRGQLRDYFARHRDRIELRGDAVSIVGGEAAKNDPAVVDDLYRVLQQRRIDRHSFVLVVGGGAVQDAAGFAAATAHRGVRVVRMPTTVLSQCDSGVGVKNGVNLRGSKNFVGSFAPPFAVVSDIRFLDRLPRRDRLAGLAESIKVALVRDAPFFSSLEGAASRLAALEVEPTREAIFRSAELHLRHIATGGDPFELGSARPLDFGHWAAHKLETLTEHELRHGEAVALGLVLDSRYAVEAGLLDEDTFARIVQLITRLGLPRWHPELGRRRPDGRPTIVDGIDEFREHLGGELTITMLRGIGVPVDVHEISDAWLEHALGWMQGAASSA